jgi:hypothetical protein
MFTKHKRVISQTLTAASAVLALSLLTACSEDSEASEASSSGSDSGSESTDPFDQALEYAECMRENGVPDFPDPVQDGGNVRIQPGGDPNSPEFQAAEEACRDKQPQGGGQLGPGGGGALDTEKVADWAQCVRENGVPDFPDPEVNGNQMELSLAETDVNPDDPEFQEAIDACQDLYPGGGMRLIGPAPQ